MPDDKSKVGEPDRSKVAKGQDYEFSYLVPELGISTDHARKLIDRFGGNREKIYAAAETLKQGRANLTVQPPCGASLYDFRLES